MSQTQNDVVLDPQSCREYLLEAKALGINPTEVDEIRMILARCAFDGRFFSRIFMAETFSHRDSWQHDEVWDLMDDEHIPRVCVMAWRGFGKTTITISKAIQNILFRRAKLVMVVGSSEQHASEITETIKGELIDNDLIRFCFGDLQASEMKTELRKRFGRSSWMVYSPTTGKSFAAVVPKGAGQRVRGLQMRIGGRIQRPDLIIVDDVEDDEEVLNEEIRAKRRNWFNGALKECVPKDRPSARTGRWNKDDDPGWKPPWRIIYCDTLKHHDANIQYIISSSEWKSVTFPMATLRESPPEETDERFQGFEYSDEKMRYYSEVSELVSTGVVRKEIEQAKLNGTFDVYCLEKLCLPVAPEGANWSRESFQYYNDDEKGLNKKQGIMRFVLVDPARTENPRSAFSAMLAVAVDPNDGHIYFRRLVNRKMHPVELIDTFIELCLSTNSQMAGIELTGVEGYLDYQLKTELRNRGVRIQILKMDTRGVGAGGDFGHDRNNSKRARAAMLAPWYERGCVFHEESLRNSPLEHQMLQFPRNKHWDALDSASHAPQFIQKAGIYLNFKSKKTSDADDDPYEWQNLTKAIRSRSWALGG